MKKIIRIFVSYSSKDRDLKTILVEGLIGHLAHRNGFSYEIWEDSQIDMGSYWKHDIEENLQKSDVALLLVSANFSASTFINNEELPFFFKKQKIGNCIIMPILLREYDFRGFEDISKIQFFKTYYPEYGFNRPIERQKLLPFDKLGENQYTTDEQLNLYYAKLAGFIHKSIEKKYGNQPTNHENDSRQLYDKLDESSNEEIHSLINFYKQSLNSGNLSEDVYFSIGICYLYIGLYDLSIRHLEKVLELVPDYVDSYYYLFYATIRGKRPMTLMPNEVKGLESILNAGKCLKANDARFDLLYFILRYDYYRLNGLKSPEPNMDVVIKSLESNKLNSAEISRLRRFIHLPDQKLNHILNRFNQP